MMTWIYKGNVEHPIADSAPFTGADGTNYPGNYPKGEIDGMSAVTDLDPTGSGEIVTYGTPVLSGDHYERTVTLSSPPVTLQMVIDERARRLAQGFDYPFGDARGTVHIGMADHDMVGWNDVDKIVNALIATGNGNQTISITPETTSITITALEWCAIMIAAGTARQPIWAASFTLEAMDPIPVDYADDSHWS